MLIVQYLMQFSGPLEILPPICLALLWAGEPYFNLPQSEIEPRSVKPLCGCYKSHDAIYVYENVPK